MSIAGLTSTEQTTAIKAVFAANDVRALVANHLGVSVGRVTDEAHFTNDLGADWLERPELMIAVEDAGTSSGKPARSYAAVPRSGLRC